MEYSMLDLDKKFKEITYYRDLIFMSNIRPDIRTDICKHFENILDDLFLQRKKLYYMSPVYIEDIPRYDELVAITEEAENDGYGYNISLKKCPCSGDFICRIDFYKKDNKE